MNDEIQVPLFTNQYERKLIILIDILGFKDFISSNYDTAKEEAVLTFTAHFQKMVSEGYKTLPKGLFQPTFHFFSDTIFISLPLELYNTPNIGLESGVDINKQRILYIARLLISDIQIYSLCHGLLTRGCLTIGAIYHKENTWFGPGLIDAHYHESKIAIYPRVILSKSAINYFNNEVVNDENNSFIQDFDGYYYVNYIAWIPILFNDEFSKVHHDLEELIIKNMEKLSAPHKIYELQKWMWLSIYFKNIPMKN